MALDNSDLDALLLRPLSGRGRQQIDWMYKMAAEFPEDPPAKWVVPLVVYKAMLHHATNGRITWQPGRLPDLVWEGVKVELDLKAAAVAYVTPGGVKVTCPWTGPCWCGCEPWRPRPTSIPSAGQPRSG